MRVVNFYRLNNFNVTVSCKTSFLRHTNTQEIVYQFCVVYLTSGVSDFFLDQVLNSEALAEDFGLY